MPCHAQESGFNEDHHIQPVPEKQVPCFLSFVVSRCHLIYKKKNHVWIHCIKNRRELCRETKGLMGVGREEKESQGICIIYNV